VPTPPERYQVLDAAGHGGPHRVGLQRPLALPARGLVRVGMVVLDDPAAPARETPARARSPGPSLTRVQCSAGVSAPTASRRTRPQLGRLCPASQRWRTPWSARAPRWTRRSAARNG